MHRVARPFFPLRETLGFDSRELTPTAVLRITVLAAEARSFERAEKTACDGAGLKVSAKTIERVVHDVGRELEQRRDAPVKLGEALLARRGRAGAGRTPPLAGPPGLAASRHDRARPCPSGKPAKSCRPLGPAGRKGTNSTDAETRQPRRVAMARGWPRGADWTILGNAERAGGPPTHPA